MVYYVYLSQDNGADFLSVKSAPKILNTGEILKTSIYASKSINPYKIHHYRKPIQTIVPMI